MREPKWQSSRAQVWAISEEEVQQPADFFWANVTQKPCVVMLQRDSLQRLLFHQNILDSIQLCWIDFIWFFFAHLLTGTNQKWNITLFIYFLFLNWKFLLMQPSYISLVLILREITVIICKWRTIFSLTEGKRGGGWGERTQKIKLKFTGCGGRDSQLDYEIILSLLLIPFLKRKRTVLPVVWSSGTLLKHKNCPALLGNTARNHKIVCLWGFALLSFGDF